MKSTAIVAILAAALGLFAGKHIPRGVVYKPLSVTTFRIKVPFNKWASVFDSKEARKMHNDNGIKPIFRGKSTNDPNQVIVIHQSEPGSVEELLSENRENIEKSGHIMRTTRTSNWSYK